MQLRPKPVLSSKPQSFYPSVRFKVSTFHATYCEKRKDGFNINIKVFINIYIRTV